MNASPNDDRWNARAHVDFDDFATMEFPRAQAPASPATIVWVDGAATSALLVREPAPWADAPECAYGQTP